ncbi:hypothetical protein [Pedococcus sp. 5OH_020]|uniref:hypothetical protein n=1 Tax=Pedococcus sp. 5OH_020 TaxID=2989814 RepID=UPI0022EA07CA|nr:hypothetical protein [Pedococcus sp. 5OH_020]
MTGAEDRDETGARPAEVVHAEQVAGFAEAIKAATGAVQAQQSQAHGFLSGPGQG